MKNKLYYILLSLLVSFSFMNNVFADEFSYTVTTDPSSSTVVLGNEATIKVNLKSNSSINACLFKVSASDGIEFVSKNGVNGWNVTEDGTNGFLVENSSTDGEALSAGKNILELKYKVNANGKVTVATDYCISTETEEQDSHAAIDVIFTTKDISKDTSLSSLTVIGGRMSEFSSDKHSYVAELTSPNFSLKMVTSNPDFQDDIMVVDGFGNILDPNNITFVDEDGLGQMQINIIINKDAKNPYGIGVKYVNTELDNSLSSLKINGNEILVEGLYDYEYTVGKNVTSVEIEAILSDSENFQFVEGNSPGTFNLSGSDQVLPIIIEPKDSQSGGMRISYYITIKKEGSTGGVSNNSNNNNNGEVTANPTTGGASMFIMAFILIVSLMSSLFLYKKNLESYK